ncbi:hypothetical protein [Telmatospirillum sp.]|uniref:hypothetical protein n=1 Tax=Telmatospirillum sp. TaxID=2079197 RepID=UPI0028504A65|nr:hypothetical protein [Telmatospirillum sp.]MDR3435430.1 hypothetical protein [Telmatospirillum sp.]
MVTTSGDAFRATPSVRRYALAGSFLTLIFAYPTFLFLVACSVLAKAIAKHSEIDSPLGAVGFGIAALSFLTVYIANITILSITFNKNDFSFRNGNRYVSVRLSEIEKICYLNSLKGWMYIIVYTSHGPFTLPNAMYFDSQFDAIKDGIADWLARHGLQDLVYREDVRVDEIGAFGSKQLPFSILQGLWKHIAFFTAFAIVATFVTGLLKVDLSGFIGRHGR